MASLVPIPGFYVSDSDRPRILYPEEIDQIISRIPYVEAADRNSSEYARQGLIEYVRAILEEEPICPSAVPQLIEEMVKMFNDSIVHPGMPAGINAAEAEGAVTTQLTLNSFHGAGSANTMAKGIDLMQDLVYARVNPKNPTTYIYFKTKNPLGVMMSYREALDTRQYLVATTLDKFVAKASVLERSDVPLSWWHDRESIPNGTKILRLKLNVDQLFKYRVTPAQFASVFDREDVRPLVAQFSPISEGIVDLFTDIHHVVNIMAKNLKKTAAPSKELISILEGTHLQDPAINEMGVDVTRHPPKTAAESSDMISILEGMYLQEIVIPEMGKVRIGGIAGLTKINPLGIPVMSAVTRERKINDEGLWKLDLHPSLMRQHNITVARIRALFEAVGIIPETEQLDDRRRVISISVRSHGKPSDIVDRRVGDLKKTKPDDQLVVLSQIMYLEASSTNLKDIRNHPLVDPDRTYCNSQYVMNSVLGREATYMLIASSMVSATQPHGITPIHGYLKAEFIMSRGYPYGTTYTGISRQGTGHLSLATVERAGEVFATHALRGKSESTRNVSAAVMVGTRVALGTGFCDIAQVIRDSRHQGEPRLYMNEDLWTQWKYDVIEQERRGIDVYAGEYDETVDDEAEFAAAEGKELSYAGLGQVPVTSFAFSGPPAQQSITDPPVEQFTETARVLVPDPRALWEATATFTSVPTSPLVNISSSSTEPISSDILDAL
jgi:hypothetical protein